MEMQAIVLHIHWLPPRMGDMLLRGVWVILPSFRLVMGQTDFWLVKTDAQGNIMWNQTYGGVGDEVAYSLVKTSDGSFALAGEQDKKLWLIKTDSNGAIQWNQTYGQAKYNQACLAVEAVDGGFVLASDNFQFIKTDSLGAVEWNHAHGIEDIDTVYALTKTIDGGFALVGETTSDDSGNGVWLIKTDSNGAIQWNQIYSRTEYDRPYTLIQTSDGGYALAGDTIYNSSTCIWVIKTDETGVIPEFPALLVLPLFLVITTILVFYKKLMPKKSTAKPIIILLAVLF